MASTTNMRRQCRGGRRGSTDSTTSAGVSVIAPRSRFTV
jgi:hypothetical protein